MESDFLVSSFPEIPGDKIRTVLESVDNNIQGAVDVLLNEVLLRELGAESEEEEKRENGGKRSRSGRAQRHRVLLTNNNTQSQHRKRRDEQTTSTNNIKENAWSYINAQAEQLAEILDIATAEAASALHRDTVWNLIVRIAATRKQKENEDLDTAAVELACEFPCLGTDRVYTLLHATGGNLEAAIFLQRMLASMKDNVKMEASYADATAKEPIIEPSDTYKSNTLERGKKDDEVEFIRIQRKNRKSKTNNRNEDDAHDHAYYAARALRLQEERNTAFGAAAQLYRRGQYAIAGSYAERARTLDAERHAWALAAARTKVESTSTETTIDLHKLPVAEGVQIALERVDAWFRSKNAQTTPRPPLVIVTGAGVHSVRGMPRIRPALERALHTHGWAYTRESPGAIAVRGRAVP